MTGMRCDKFDRVLQVEGELDFVRSHGLTIRKLMWSWIQTAVKEEEVGYAPSSFTELRDSDP